MSDSLNRYSKRVTQDQTQPAAQAMLHAIGLNEADMLKPQVGIASMGWEGNPCNMHLNALSTEIKQGVNEEGLVGLIFHTIGVSDGISMGTPGMRYSLPSRDIIADSIETVVSAQWYDGLITVVGCDKNLPGAMMAIGRLNRPSILVYGGTIAAGNHKGRQLDIVSAFEALGEKSSGKMDEDEFTAIIRNACPGAGACGGMYTANTMASAIEAMGMSLPYNASIPAVDRDKKSEGMLIGPAIHHCLQHNITPRRIVSRASLFNALAVIMALGGSTNAVIHMIAIARAFDLALDLDDIQYVSDHTPLLADLKPSGCFLMQDFHREGGVPMLMKLLLKYGYLNGNCMTVTGKTVAENLEGLRLPGGPTRVIHPIEKPIKETGHIQILYGNLAEEGSVAKITGKEGESFEGTASVFDSEELANEAIQDGKIKEGDVVVIRYCGPRGAPGMPEMLKPTSLIMGAGLGKKVALITDGRFSGGTHGFVVGHICPEAWSGGMIALIENGDKLEIDAGSGRILLCVEDDELEKRRREWKRPQQAPLQGILKKYRQSVSPASKGCVTD